jgi:hypothetical protein
MAKHGVDDDRQLMNFLITAIISITITIVVVVFSQRLASRMFVFSIIPI